MDKPAIMELDDFAAALDWQATHADENGAPCTARIIRALEAVAKGNTRVAQRMTNWPGLTLKDAMPLRIAGGLHFLNLSGADDSLVSVYSGEIADQHEVNVLVCAVVEAHDEALLPWFDGPPQTNEAGRSASIMAGLFWLAQSLPARFEMFELGASAGVNTMMDRYFYRLGETRVGPQASPMQITPEWRGASPPTSEIEIIGIRGCDIAPIDLSDPDMALRLKSYVWPDAQERMQRVDAAIQLAGERAPELTQMDAGDFVREQLERPQEAGMTKVLFHSIMWQYMPAETQSAITQAMEKAGAKATAEKPLAWVSLETDPATFRHELRVRYWPGGEEDACLAHAHPHGAWVEWLGR